MTLKGFTELTKQKLICTLLLGCNFIAWLYFKEHHWIALSEFVLWWMRVDPSGVVIRS